MNSILKQAAWIALALVGAISLGTVALSRGESINALWIVVAAVEGIIRCEGVIA